MIQRTDYTLTTCPQYPKLICPLGAAALAGHLTEKCPTPLLFKVSTSCPVCSGSEGPVSNKGQILNWRMSLAGKALFALRASGSRLIIATPFLIPAGGREKASKR
jgi:hypothetical protein